MAKANSLVTTNHICNVCNKHFPESQLEIALKHASKPIIEGDFNGVVLRGEEGYPLYLYQPTNEVDPSHERLYNEWVLFDMSVANLDLFEKNPKEARLMLHRHISDYSVSELKKKIKDKERLPLTPDELKRLQSFIDKSDYSSSLYLKNLRTI